MRKIFAKKVTSKIGPKGWVRFQPTAFIGRGNSMSKELKKRGQIKAYSPF